LNTYALRTFLTESLFATSVYPFILVALVFTPNSPLHAQSDLQGYFRSEVGLRPFFPSEVIFARNIVQLDIPSSNQFPWIQFSVQLRQDLSGTDPLDLEFRVREAYLPIYTRNADIKVGQQLISWGRSDLYQIFDGLSSYDLREFLTQEFSDLQLGTPAINATWYVQNNHFQLLLLPIFTPTLTPESTSRWSIIPTSNFTAIPGEKPKNSLKNMQLALTWSVRSSLQWDLDLGIFRGFPNTPAYAKQAIILPNGIPAGLTIQNTYSPSAALLASWEFRTTNNLILMTETAYWFRRSSDIFPNNLAALTADPEQFSAVIQSYNAALFQRETGQLVSTAGIQLMWLQWDIRAQILLEYLTRHKADTLQDRYYTSASILLRRAFLSERLATQLLVRYNSNASDYWINPNLQYTIRDAFQTSLGYHHFDGSIPPNNYGHLSFNQFRQNNFAYLKLSYWW
jgi:hypothetical protein